MPKKADQITPWYTYNPGWWSFRREYICLRRTKKVFALPTPIPKRIRFHFFVSFSGRYCTQVYVRGGRNLEVFLEYLGYSVPMDTVFYQRRLERHAGKTIYVELEYEA